MGDRNLRIGNTKRLKFQSYFTDLTYFKWRPLRIVADLVYNTVVCHLLAGAVGADAGAAVVAGAVEGDESAAAALLVVHLVTAVHLDAVHLDGAAALARHHHLGAHHLQQECQRSQERSRARTPHG